MMKYTPLQTLSKVHRELWWTIRLLGSAQVQIHENLANYDDCVEVGKVLREVVVEVERMIARQRDYERKSLNRRPGIDLALKAKVAKATSKYSGSLQILEDPQSHK